MEKSAVTYITEVDMERLENLIQRARDMNGHSGSTEVRALEDELQFADVVSPREIPSDVVTMRSRIMLRDLDSGDTSTYTIVFPTETDAESGQISVLAPLALAVLGRRAGETIEFRAPSRVRRIKVEEILYQPESAGDFAL